MMEGIRFGGVYLTQTQAYGNWKSASLDDKDIDAKAGAALLEQLENLYRDLPNGRLKQSPEDAAKNDHLLGKFWAFDRAYVEAKPQDRHVTTLLRKGKHYLLTRDEAQIALFATYSLSIPGTVKEKLYDALVETADPDKPVTLHYERSTNRLFDITV